MPKITGLDVPPELLSDFYSAVKLTGDIDEGRIDSKHVLQSRSLLQLLTAKQGNPKWVSFYKSLSSHYKFKWSLLATNSGISPGKQAALTNSIREVLSLEPLTVPSRYFVDFILLIEVSDPASDLHIRLSRSDIVKFPVSLVKFPDKLFIKTAINMNKYRGDFSFCYSSNLTAFGANPYAKFTASLGLTSNDTEFSIPLVFDIPLSCSWSKQSFDFYAIKWPYFPDKWSAPHWTYEYAFTFWHTPGYTDPIVFSFDFIAGAKYHLTVSRYSWNTGDFHITAAGVVDQWITGGDNLNIDFVAVSSAHMTITPPSAYSEWIFVDCYFVGVFHDLQIDVELNDVRGSLALDNLRYKFVFAIAQGREITPYKLNSVPLDTTCDYVKTENLPAGCTELWQAISVPSGASFDKVFLDFEAGVPSLSIGFDYGLPIWL